MDHFGEAIYDNKDRIPAICSAGELGYQVHADVLPWVIWNGKRMQQPTRFGIAGFVVLTGIAGADVVADGSCHVGPVKVSADAGQGSVFALMACCRRIMMEFQNVLLKASGIFRNVDAF